MCKHFPNHVSFVHQGEACFSAYRGEQLIRQKTLSSLFSLVGDLLSYNSLVIGIFKVIFKWTSLDILCFFVMMKHKADNKNDNLPSLSFVSVNYTFCAFGRLCI